jgi:hypothetical protein
MVQPLDGCRTESEIARLLAIVASFASVLTGSCNNAVFWMFLMLTARPHPTANDREFREREKIEFVRRLSSMRPFKGLGEKYFSFVLSEIVIISAHPASSRGAYASSRTWSGLRWT